MKDIFEPLNEDELHWLDQFLLDRIDDDADCEGKDEGVLGISELDGLMTAIVSGPVMVPPSQWVPHVWADFPPDWKDGHEIQQVMSLLMRHMNSISGLLMQQPEDFEPMFEQHSDDGKTYTIVDEWCEGYMRGVALTAGAWDLDSMKMKILLAPIGAFTEEKGFYAHEHCNEQEFENLQKAIAPNVREIHAHWLALRSDHAPAASVIHSEPKVGRNDPCPCGSGKKFKKCCLH
ncbi:MAG: UPF0149 family protein [Lysobacterales bacterium]